MKLDRSKIKRILVINLSNIGDAILTTPVIQALRNNFPKGHLAVLVGPRAFCVFKNDRRIDKKIIYDKKICWKNKLGLVNRLRQDKYDLVVDLRQSAFAMLLGAKYRTSVLKKAPKSLTHMKDKHLWKLKSLGLDIAGGEAPGFIFSEDESDYINRLFNKWQIEQGQKVVAIACGARSMTKRWEKEGFRQLIQRLNKEYKAKIVMVGDEQDELLAQDVISQIKPRPFNLCGKTTIGQLAYLLTRSKLLVSNDSAPMHLAWILNIPVVAIFGPTDYKKYAPAGARDIVIRKNLACAPCEKSLCPKGTRECMKLITADEVFSACKKILQKGK